MGNETDSEKLKDIVYSMYLEYLKSTNRVNLSKLRKSYDAIYFWMKDHLKKDLPKKMDSRILVIACGIGHEVYALSRMGYKNVLGIDISEEQLEVARNNGLNCIKADVFEYLKNNNEKFDVIVAFSLIEHFKINKAFELLKLCYNNLYNDGILILKTPNLNNPLALKWIYGDITHEVAFNDTSLTQLLIAAGFEKIKFKNVKSFGKFDDKFTKRVLKTFMAGIVNLTWNIIKLFYWLNGVKPPEIVSADLLAIAYKKGDNNEKHNT